MQTKIHEAKRRLLPNIGSNILNVFFTAVVNVWLTPYYIKHLGVDGYGLIPLVVSFIAYFRIFSMSISNAISRFVVIELGRDNVEKGNLYFNTALVAVVIISFLAFLPVVAISFYFPDIFDVPAQHEATAGILFLCIILSSFFMSFSECFRVSTYYTHRFDLYNIVQILSRFIRVGVIIAAFSLLSISLIYVGVSYLIMAGFCLLFAVLLTIKLTPQIRIKPSLFDWCAFKEMLPMSFWMITNEVGTLLYLSVSFIIVNLFLGSESGGYYGPLVQLVSVVTTLCWTVCNVFTPIAYDYISHNDLEGLSFQVQRLMKFMSLIVGLLICVICGLSKPILEIWLGDDFIHVQPLLWLIMIPWYFAVAMMPVISVYKGLNKLKIPTLATLGFGIVNVVTAVLLVGLTDLGLYSIAIALLFSLAGKHLLFSPIYLALITQKKASGIIMKLVPVAMTTVLISSLAVLATKHILVVSVLQLIIAAIIVSFLYVAISYALILNKSDRKFVMSVIYKRVGK